MCGIAGMIGESSAEVAQAVRRMTAAMEHRGPDDGGQFAFDAGNQISTAKCLSLGFRRLAILDLTPTGHQPMIHPETGDCLVFNGEIYNFRSLRSRLSAEGVHFRGTSDSEVLLHALGRWGESTVERLEGMYAFAFFRVRDQSLLLGRDPLGIKPLYITEKDGRVIFASEQRAILASRLVSDQVDLAGLAGVLAYGSVQAERTLFRDIRAFPAGCVRTLSLRDEDKRGGDVRRTWQFPSVNAAVPRPEATATVRTLLEDAVATHLVADVPAGIFLSAGIDSTIIAACAAKRSQTVTAFTVGIGDEYPYDEVAVARQTAERLGLPHRVVRIAENTLPELWESWLQGGDSPSVDGFNTFLVSKALVENGMKVGLSGLGADELFGGYPVFRRAGKLATASCAVTALPQSVRKLLVRALACLLAPVRTRDKLSDTLLAGPHVEDIVLSLRRIFSDRDMDRIGLAGMNLGIPDAFIDRSCSVDRDTPRADIFAVISQTEMTHYMRDTLLRDSDATSMRHSLELRVPFLDRRLVEYASSLPAANRQPARGLSKQLLRDAFRNEIGEVVGSRGKTGFVLPIGDWMRGRMRDACEAAISTLCSLPEIRAPEMRALWTRFLETPEAMHWSKPFAAVVAGAYLAQIKRAR